MGFNQIIHSVCKLCVIRKSMMGPLMSARFLREEIKVVVPVVPYVVKDMVPFRISTFDRHSSVHLYQNPIVIFINKGIRYSFEESGLRVRVCILWVSSLLAPCVKLQMKTMDFKCMYLCLAIGQSF
jgi:hypothetical protein